MAIRVTCPQCHTRFDVSDRFAGREGPCPKCKNKIKIPDKQEEVVIAVPDDAPKDSKGRSILKPIARKDTVLSSTQIALIACSIIGFLAVALAFRIMNGGDPEKFPTWLAWVAAFVIAPPIAYAAYTFLRDQDLAKFLGSELRNRILICSAIYGALWLAMPLGYYAFNNEWMMGSWISAMVSMLLIGAAAGMLVLDFDYLMGLLHYGMYLSICLIGRWLAGIGVFPGMLGGETAEPTDPFARPAAAIEFFQQIELLIGCWF